jgi:hypothetical protein
MDEVISVVGRARTVEQLLLALSELLYGGFNVFSWHSLGQPSEVDHKDRFIVFIAANDETEFPIEVQFQRLQQPEFSTRLFDSMDEALEYAGANYDLDEAKINFHEELEQLIEEFPQITAKEVEHYQVLDAFMKLGKVSAVPAKFHDERAVALVLVTHGHDEVRVTPMAILVTEDIEEYLELPGEE